MTSRLPNPVALLLLSLCLSLCDGARAETFPQPAELAPDVDFWVAVFSRYDSGEGILHDNRRLEVVYERIDMPASLSRGQRQKKISERRKALQSILRTLAGGKREGLSAEEARVLALWPEGVSNATLRAAAGRIRFQLGLADRFRDGLIRSGRWRDFIEAELEAMGVPAELAALPHVESSYNPEARSHVGASGIWQFTRSTARRFMRVDHVLDERNDPYSATRGAARLLAYNHSITGNWPMAITAYNHGLAGVRRAMRQFGDTAYVDILREYNGRTFGFASRNFYVAFLAAMKIDRDPDTYFPGIRPEAALVYDAATLDAYLPVAEVSRALGIDSRELAKHNPSLQATIWTGSKHLPRGFALRVPADMLAEPLADLLAAVPSQYRADEQLPDLYHTVARGDTLSEIAESYDTRVSTLVALNNLGSRHRIRAGQRLRLPAAGPAPQASVAAVTAAPAASPADLSAATGGPAATASSGSATAGPGGAAANGASGETLSAAEEPAPDAIAGEVLAAVEELTPAAMAGEPDASEPTVVRTALLSDPSDYSVADDLTIEVQPLETLGHFADWLGIRTQRLRDINGLAFRTPVVVGERIRLEVRDVDVATFESRRIEYHRRQQDRFFREHVITGLVEHTIQRGESIWVLSLRVYDVPVWLFRQYNPSLDLDRVRPGTTVKFPRLAKVQRP